MEIASSSLKSFIDPLIDLIHGDLVLEDICCQRVAGAFVEHHEAALRRLVTSHTLPSGLEKAIESYCVRSYLLSAPELLTESHEVAQMLKRLADSLTEAARDPKGEQQSGRHNIDSMRLEDDGAWPPLAEVSELKAGSAAYLLARSGEIIKEDVAALQAQPETQRCARLIDALGEVVLGYIMYAAQQCAQQAQEYLDGASRYDTGVAYASYHAPLHQFVKSALEHREARKRERDAAQEADVQALLFGSDHAIVEPVVLDEGRHEEIEDGLAAAQDPAQHDTPSAPSASPEVDFAAQVQAAMESKPSSPQSPPQSLLKHLTLQTTGSNRGRTLHSVNDSVAEQFEALVDTTPPATLKGQKRQSTPVESSAPHQTPLAAAEGQTSAPAEPSLSPEIVVDPFSLAAASSSFVTSSERDAPQGNDVEPRPPHQKLRKAGTVFIGASETSVLRMMERTDDNGDRDCHLLSSPTSASASVPSTTLPMGAQRLHDSDGTTGGTVFSTSTVPAVDVVDAWEGVRRCLQRQDAEPRSYFLCGATHRFEPCAARGFF